MIYEQMQLCCQKKTTVETETDWYVSTFVCFKAAHSKDYLCPDCLRTRFGNKLIFEQNALILCFFSRVCPDWSVIVVDVVVFVVDTVYAIRRAVISKEVLPDLWCLYFIYPQQRLVNMIVKGRRNIKTGGCKAINYTSSKVITETGIFWIMQTLSLFFSRQEYKYQHQKYKTQTFSNGRKLGHSCDLSNVDSTNVLVAQRCFINMIWRI